MFGKIQLKEFKGLTEMPQDAATAWAAACEGFVGANYKPLLYLGWQLVDGLNHFFIAEQTLIVDPPIRRIVKLIINNQKIIHVEEIL